MHTAAIARKVLSPLAPRPIEIVVVAVAVVVVVVVVVVVAAAVQQTLLAKYNVILAPPRLHVVDGSKW